PHGGRQCGASPSSAGRKEKGRPGAGEALLRRVRAGGNPETISRPAFRRNASESGSDADLYVFTECGASGRTFFSAGYDHKKLHARLVSEYHGKNQDVHTFYHP